VDARASAPLSRRRVKSRVSQHLCLGSISHAPKAEVVAAARALALAARAHQVARAAPGFVAPAPFSRATARCFTYVESASASTPSVRQTIVENIWRGTARESRPSPAGRCAGRGPRSAQLSPGRTCDGMPLLTEASKLAVSRAQEHTNGVQEVEVGHQKVGNGHHGGQAGTVVHPPEVLFEQHSRDDPTDSPRFAHGRQTSEQSVLLPFGSEEHSWRHRRSTGEWQQSSVSGLIDCPSPLQVEGAGGGEQAPCVVLRTPPLKTQLHRAGALQGTPIVKVVPSLQVQQ
jgi:hypothetical protein